ncbi:MAG TPA: archaemetzincin [Pyrinomonadaceae bacterium]|jgi:archaemetzincin|nr:archaemetzincin [Pyrinomonadaceae bacterium]
MRDAITEIAIVPVGNVDRPLLEYLTLTLPEKFAAACVVRPIGFDIDDSYHATRQQHHSTRLLAKLRGLGGKRRKILGITDFDLFIPIFTFVFGEAEVGGCAALMSTHRLRQEFYGLPEDRELLFLRAEKEAVHELGHTRGLAHCRSFDCVMRFSNSVEQVDLKPFSFCPLCEARLHKRTGSNGCLNKYEENKLEEVHA